MDSDYFQEISPEATSPQENRASDRSIRNINMTPSRPRMRDSSEPLPQVPMRGPRQPIGRLPRRGGRRTAMWISAGVAIAVLLCVWILAGRPTTITVTPQKQNVSLTPGVQLTAIPSTSAASGAKTIHYSLQTFKADESVDVPASGTQHVETKASGQITVYNNHSSAAVRFVKTTRFESQSGLIFRTPADIVIPGKSATKPGSVTITVIADKTGDLYNIAASKFTVPGLKGSKEYDGIYATSDTAFTGGFSGEQPAVAPSDLLQAQKQLTDELNKKIDSHVNTLISGDVLVIPSLIQTTVAPAAQTSSEKKGMATLRVTSVSKIPLFSSSEVGSALARAGGLQIGDALIAIKPGTGFSATSTALAGASGTETISITFSGAGTLVWRINSNAIISALQGKSKDSFEAIIKNFPGISEATARLMPPWKSTFPQDPNRIKINVLEVTAQAGS